MPSISRIGALGNVDGVGWDIQGRRCRSLLQPASVDRRDGFAGCFHLREMDGIIFADFRHICRTRCRLRR
ncbi:MAG: hypothetical protein MZV63_60460 [Marinilabiliales bacterium]|nr:hypothetical protein [Marinilabiliales bacterium]